MASSYSSRLRIDLPANGDTGWATALRTDLGTLLEEAIAGYTTKAMSDANYTLSTANGATDEARQMMLKFTGTLTANRNIIVPTSSKIYFIDNACSGAFSLVVKTASGSGVTIPNGSKAVVYCDGTNVLAANAIDYTQTAPWTGKHTFHGDLGSGSGATPLTAGVAIGTQASATYASIEMAASAGAFIDFSSVGTDYKGRVIYDNAGNYFAFHTNGSERVRLDSSGRLGIGATSIAYRLHVVETGNADVAQFINTHASFSSVAFRSPVTRTNDATWWFFLASSNGYTDIEFNLRGDGNAFCDGAWAGGGADYAEYFEWADGNPDNEDRRGFSVVLIGDQIRKATPSDAASDILGVISGNPSVIGDAAWNMWKGKYLRDDFGTYLREPHTVTEWTELETWEEQEPNPEDPEQMVTVTRSKEVPHSYASDQIPEGVTVPEGAVVKTHDDKGALLTRRILNPDYDPNEEYTPREKRPEWSTVGLMGKIRLRAGQPTGDRWRKMRDVSETVEEWLVR